VNAYREEVLEAAGRKARNWKRMGKSENREGIEFFELKITEFKATCLRNNLILSKSFCIPFVLRIILLVPLFHVKIPPSIARAQKASYGGGKPSIPLCPKL